MPEYIRWFEDLSLQDVAVVGGKNASLGELVSQLGEQVRVPPGFAITAEAYWSLLDQNRLREPLSELLGSLDRKSFANLARIGAQARELVLQAELPQALADAIRAAHAELQKRKPGAVAARSSATAEDLPEASFAGLQDSFLHLDDSEALLRACLCCYASLFTDRAIKYRQEQGFAHEEVALSIAVQAMVRSDRASAGVCFTIDPDSGFERVVYLTGAWGLGENVVQGQVDPDEFYVYKPALQAGKPALLWRKLGSKALTMVYAEADPADAAAASTRNLETPPARRRQFVLSEPEVLALARTCLLIEAHYGRAMDIEWAKDAEDGCLYIVQARPETVHSRAQAGQLKRYRLREQGELLLSGQAIGKGIVSGKVRRLDSPSEAASLREGEILVAAGTNPDWDPLLKKAAAIVTDHGSRTSHAAIIARESGTLAVIGTGEATSRLKTGQEITVACSEGQRGKVYAGCLAWDEQAIEPGELELPERPEVRLILADPGQAFSQAMLPSHGVGLMRLEFAISELIRVHPMALVEFAQLEDAAAKAEIAALIQAYDSPEDYFVETLSQAVAMLAAAFAPRDLIVRLSDFKSNEYANLIGGQAFEPAEANPMLGFRGAARYVHPRFREAFRLECKAMKRAREVLGFSNIKLMIPFCRSLAEADAVLAILAEAGLARGEQGLEIYLMCELPVNVVLARDFARRFDGFSIGSNDLTQLVLGIDRDSELLAESFDEQAEAVMRMIRAAIEAAHAEGIPVGLCGQAPSDHPEFARFLVEAGIDSISFSPDALFEGLSQIRKALSGGRPAASQSKSRPRARQKSGAKQARHRSGAKKSAP